MKPLKVIIVAYNQKAFVEAETELLKLYANVREDNIIIVDNGSDDGMAEWLNNSQYDYVVCDKGGNGYAEILNTVIHEFHIDTDILILNPAYFVLPYALEEMGRVLHEEKMTGAVSPTMIPLGNEIAKDYETAVDCVMKLQESTAPSLRNRGQIGLKANAVMLKAEMLREIGEFDKELTLPHNVMTDYSFRADLKGYKLLECGNAYFYAYETSSISRALQMESSADRRVLKDKWNMNYFNIQVNWNLMPYIQKKEYEEFSVLEVGCDCGANLYEGIKNEYPNAKIYGTEINKHAARIAACFFSVQTGNIEDHALDFGDEKFDYIIFGDVLEHLHDPTGTILYCKELLKKDGHILASIPNLMHYSVMKDLLNGNFTYTDTGLLDRTHIHFFTYKEIIKMFESAGYVIEKIDPFISSSSLSLQNEWVEKLLSISDEAEAFMFRAFQYLVSAKKIDN